MPKRINYRFAIHLCCLIVVVILSSKMANAQAHYTTEELNKHFQTVAEEYEIKLGDAALTLRPQPLMHWQNPERQQDQGALYVWERNGRPQVLGSIFTYEFSGIVHCRHEMISLADGPLSATLQSRVVWSLTPMQRLPSPESLR